MRASFKLKSSHWATENLLKVKDEDRFRSTSRRELLTTLGIEKDRTIGIRGHVPPKKGGNPAAASRATRIAISLRREGIKFAVSTVESQEKIRARKKKAQHASSV